MGSLDFGSGFRGSRNLQDGGNFSTGGASHLIRSAEKLASSGRFDFAIEQLSVAQRLDPGNKYIQAIIDRIRTAQNNPQDGNPSFDNLVETQGALAITVDPRSASGLRRADEDQNPAPEDTATQIRFLTNMAEQFLENGSSERAFDSLMKAYLLDPLSPYVMASEKAILPAWESSRMHMNNIPDTARETMTQKNTDGISGFSQRPTQPESAEDQLRIDVLRQQKETEREESERAEWRDASKPLKVLGKSDGLNLSTLQQTPLEQPKPQPTGLFSKLRLGKFLE